MTFSGWARLWIVATLSLAACNRDQKPPHYYVLCEDVDGAGWRLIDAQKDKQGYLMSCTYQSPDKKQIRTARCRPEGCD